MRTAAAKLCFFKEFAICLETTAAIIENKKLRLNARSLKVNQKYINYINDVSTGSFMFRSKGFFTLSFNKARSITSFISVT